MNECRSRWVKKALAFLTLSMILVALLPSAGHRATAASYPDTSGLPPEIRGAIDYVTEMGYMGGDAAGRFNPTGPVTRMDYARALVKLFRKLDEATDPGIAFTDVKTSEADFRYANLAVKHGYLSPSREGSFKPKEPLTAAGALTGLTVGLQMDLPVTNLEGLYPRGPSYRGHLIVAHDLHLKYGNTRVWPDDDYPRGEMAFSLQMVDELEEWRTQYVRESFDWLHCQSPILDPERQKAFDAAFARVGAPYVWGGESDAEHGFDCSGLTYYALSSVLGYPMMRVADDQARDGRYPTVGRKELMAGDAIFFYDSSTDTSGHIGHAAMYIGQGLFIHSTGSNAGVSVDCLTGYWGENFAWGKRVIKEPEPETFDTYILLCNPEDSKAAARLTYMLPTGQRFNRDVQLKPHSRKTVKVDDTLVNQEVSTAVEVTRGQLIAERSMYFRYRGRYPGGHDSPGVTAPSLEWYLPEGCTAWGFDTFLLIQNPGQEAAKATLTFMKDDGEKVTREYPVGPCSRCTVAVDSIPGMQRAEFATRVVSDKPVVVERSMYFDYKGSIREGHNSPGVMQLSKDWYFAEGYTAGGFDTYVLLMNPGDVKAPVTVSLLADDGTGEDITLEIPPGARRTVAVDRIKGWENREFSIEVHSRAVPIAAERAMYFDYDGITGGHDAMGNPALSNVWYLAEGYTAQAFDTYILLANPGDKKATVSVRYVLNGGRYLDRKYPVGANSRYTICVDKEEGLSEEEVSACITSTRGIVVERSMYFRYGQVAGGSCAPAVTGPSPSWFFAEGYTGR